MIANESEREKLTVRTENVNGEYPVKVFLEMYFRERERERERD